jgi:hypothetical protein
MKNIKVEILIDTWTCELEDKVNAFIRDKDVISMQYQASQCGYSVLIIYKGKNEEE